MTRRLKRAVILAVPTLPILVAACGRDAARAASRVPLYDDLGALHREVTTTVPLAQRYFDQGLRLVYGFNHEEAVNSFQEAIRCRAGKRARGARRRSVLRAAARQCQGVLFLLYTRTTCTSYGDCR